MRFWGFNKNQTTEFDISRPFPGSRDVWETFILTLGLLELKRFQNLFLIHFEGLMVS